MSIIVEDVEKVITSSLDTDTFINLSQCIMDQYSIEDTYTESCSNSIHTYLTAHFIAVSDTNNRLKSRDLDDISEIIQDTTSASLVGSSGSLYSTIYGQQVKMFDYMNLLADLGSTSKRNIVFGAI